MKKYFISFLLPLTFFAASIFTAPPFTGSAEAAKALPPPPRYYVLDEPRVLSRPILESLQSILVEHDHLTDEQVVIAIFKSLDGEDPIAWTNQVFSNWGVGTRGKDNGALLALFWKEHKSRIEVGYGLESVLTDAKSKLILTEYLLPELKSGNPDRALSLATFQILKVLDSPLVQNGKAQEILRSGGFQGSWRPQRPHSNGWSVWIILGFILLFIVLKSVTSTDTHFSRDGWYRPRVRFPRRGSWDHWSSGGGFGGWGGLGGSGQPGEFRGGGGSSGGGGASGDW